jgi:hypothetical protein
MSTPMTPLQFENGKYTLTYHEGRLQALRYGEPWRDLSGDNLIYHMMLRIQSLEGHIEEMNKIDWAKPVASTQEQANPVCEHCFTMEHQGRHDDSCPTQMPNPAAAQAAEEPKLVIQKCYQCNREFGLSTAPITHCADHGMPHDL